MDWLKYERCTICDWYELDPFNVAPHHRHVEDGVCHVCLTACRGAQFVPSAALPDPFEGVLGAALGVEDLSHPLGWGLGLIKTGSTAVSLPPLVSIPSEPQETSLEPSNQDTPAVPGT